MNSTQLNRVPQVVLTYWAIKIAATTLGETGADAFSHTLNLGYTFSSLFFIGIFVVALIKKLTIKRFTPILYWVVFTASSLAGTALCDFMDRTLALGYEKGSAVLLIVLLVILFMWKKSEKSISVENIFSSKAEIFYWSAFLVSNTLGTAIGDYLADTLELGFVGGASLVGGLLLLTILLHFYTKVSTIFLFWFAFIWTRPFGATFGDFLTKPLNEGGLNLGTIGSSIFFLILLIYLIRKEHISYTTKSIEVQND